MPGWKQSTNSAEQNNNNAAAAVRASATPMPISTTLQSMPIIDFEQALAFVNKVKSRFAEDKAMYKEFLSILERYKIRGIDVTEVCRRVSVLFRENEDLLAEFSLFLPESRV